MAAARRPVGFHQSLAVGWQRLGIPPWQLTATEAALVVRARRRLDALMAAGQAKAAKLVHQIPMAG